MHSSSRTSHLFLSLFLLLTSAQADLTNVNVKRVIDVGSTLEISKTTITMHNGGKEPATFFYVSVRNEEADGLGDFWVVDANRPTQALKTELSDDVPGLSSCCTGYKVYFRSPLTPGAEATVDVRMDVAQVITPIPAVIQGHASQYMRYSGNAYFYSPYHTKTMETTLILGSPDVTSKTGFIKPLQQNGKRIKLGPYTDVKPLAHEHISIRFKNDKGFLVAKQMIKQFYVSHWGTIAAKEEYVIVNAGARHEGEWSRVDHSGYKSKYGTALGDVWADLPADATRVDYRDLVGNITTSRLRKPSGGKRPIQLTFRYPIMGGWQNHFWVTYDMILDKYAVSKAGEHILKLPVFPSANLDLPCKDLKVRILLPEGARSIEVSEHPSLRFDVSKTTERTTLTLFGRPVLTLGLKDVRSHSKHEPTVTITYRYNVGLVWVTPIVVAAAIFSLFVGCIVCVRNGLSLSSEDANKLSPKPKSS